MTAGPGGTIPLHVLEIGVSVFSCNSPAGTILLEPFSNRQRRGFSLFICNLNRPPDDLCLRDIPPSRQALKPFGSLFIKRETRSVHCSHHTIIICGNYCRDKRSGTLRRYPAAEKAHCEFACSEDLNTGQRLICQSALRIVFALEDAMTLEKSIRPISCRTTHAAEMLQQINDTQNPIVITQHGWAKGILLDTRTEQEIDRRDGNAETACARRTRCGERYHGTE